MTTVLSGFGIYAVFFGRSETTGFSGRSLIGYEDLLLVILALCPELSHLLPPPKSTNLACFISSRTAI